jgi:hypothetical protein
MNSGVTRKVQNALFPYGVVGSAKGVGTPTLPNIYRCFSAAETEELKLASPEGFEPSLPP